MPLKWKRGENPYRVNYFTILGLGPNAHRGVITAIGKNLRKKLKSKQHTVSNRDIKETDIQEAETRLLDEPSWAEEVLLVHPAPETESKRLQNIGKAIVQQTTPPPSFQKLKLTNLKSLTPLIPEPSPDDVSLPKWEEFAIPDTDSPENRRSDIQFDL